MASIEPIHGPSPNRTRLGYIVKMFPRLSETFIRNEIIELERLGLTPHIFSLKSPGQSEDRGTAPGWRALVTYLPDRVHREPLRILRAQLGVLCSYPRGYLRTLLHVLRGRDLQSLGRGLRRFCQTCCLVHEMGGLKHLHAHFATDPTRLASWARMICGVSYSVTTHAKDLFQDGRISSPGLRYKLSLARFVVTNSDFSTRSLRACLDKETGTRVLTIYNGVDLRNFPFRHAEPEKQLILSVGRLVEKKGFEQLIRACKHLNDRGVRFECEIIGSGEMKNALHNLIARFDLKEVVRLNAQVTQSELREHYSRALVFALPCIVAANGDRDILPNVLKEAMAVGVPVITTRLEGIEELITNEETGLLVPTGNIEALAEGLERLLTDASLRQRLTAKGRQAVEERFDLRTNFIKLAGLLRAASDEVEDISAPSLQVAEGQRLVEPMCPR